MLVELVSKCWKRVSVQKGEDERRASWFVFCVGLDGALSCFYSDALERRLCGGRHEQGELARDWVSFQSRPRRRTDSL